MYVNREFVMIPKFDRQWKRLGLGDKRMSVYKSIMQGLDEAVKYQEGKIKARKTKIAIKPVAMFSSEDIKRIRLSVGLSQVVFASSIGVSPKTVEAWEHGRNKPAGPSRRLLEIIRDNPDVIKQFMINA
ncbi:MAG: helix-turn-helix domain-containing protein [Candidatus Caldatribacteriota bacterium]